MKNIVKRVNIILLSTLLIIISCSKGDDNFGIKKSDCGTVELYEEVGYGFVLDFVDNPTIATCEQYVAFTRALIKVCIGSIPEEYASNIEEVEDFLDGFSCSADGGVDSLLEWVESNMPR